MTRTFTFKIDWLWWFLLLLPTYYSSGQDLRDVQLNFFQISVVVLLGIIHVNKWLGGFLLWCVLQAILFPDMRDNPEHLKNLFLGLLLYQLIFMFTDGREIKKYCKAIFIMLILNIVWCFLQMKQIDPIFGMRDLQYQTVFTEYPGFFALPAFLGNYAAVALPLSALISYWVIPIFAIPLILSKSTFSVLAAYGAILFFLWFRKRILFWITLIVMTLALGFYAIKFDMPTGQFERRLRVWETITKVAFQKQWTGWGLGGMSNFYFGESEPLHRILATTSLRALKEFAVNEARDNGKLELMAQLEQVSESQYNSFDLSREMQKHKLDIKAWAQAHNCFLQALFETGIIGMVFVFGYLCDIFKRFWQYGRNNLVSLSLASAFVAILLVAFGHFPFHLARLAGPFIAVMALLEVALKELERKLEVA